MREIQFQQGGLASPVGTDHAQAFAGFDVKTQVIDHGLVAVALDQVVDRQQRVRHAGIVPA